MISPARSDPATAVLTKHHGLGNDFLIALDPGRRPDGSDARRWCDRHTGIGADGLILAFGEDGPDGEPGRRWRMVLWNADGGRAELSGNGIRCLGQAIAEHLALDRSIDQDLVVATDAGTRAVTVQAGGSPAGDVVRVGMGKAVEGPAVSERWSDAGVEVVTQWGVDIGNPHLVAVVESLGSADMSIIGPIVEADHPGGLNVHLVEVIDRGRLELATWERGAGVTRACGSGACAAAWAANRAGLVEATVAVAMPGGTALIELSDDDIFLSGPTVRVAEIRPTADRGPDETRPGGGSGE